jgi:hypothetical protein
VAGSAAGTCALRLGLLCLVCVAAGCAASPPAHPPADARGVPCRFLTQPIAARISGDASLTNLATDVAEGESGYVACIFTDAMNEANVVEVQIKRVAGGVTPSALQVAARYFSAGEPVQPFQPFAAVAIGERALGESTPGVAFIVFSEGNALVSVGADSSFRSVAALQAGVDDLAKQVAAWLWPDRMLGLAG